MKRHRGFLSERFVDTLGGVREALCCRRLKHEREAFCATVATEQLLSNVHIAVAPEGISQGCRMFETRNELEGFRWTGESYVNFSSFLFSVFGFKDGLLDKTGQISAAI